MNYFRDKILSRDWSFWPKHFLDEAESQEIAGGVSLWFLGSPSFLYQSRGASIYIDPCFGPTPAEAEEEFPGIYRATAVPIYPAEITRADAALSTHHHSDHCYEPTLVAL